MSVAAGDNSATSTSSSSSNDPATVPRILTASLIPSLTQGLDASSVLECYVLQRTALLHGLANSTIPVRKLALGLRYRPPSASLLSSLEQRRREFTLEYGPLRQGLDLTHEAIPRLVTHDDEGEGSQQQKFVAWDNEARIYFTTRISPNDYHSATYVATMTGAVLKNLLQTAVAYPTKSRRRYQPFSVYKKSTNELLLKSSSDLDFLLALLQHLADVGVDLSPLILPNRWQLRLIASDVQRVHVGNNDNFDSLDPTLFYSKLYNCLTSMATANYSMYEQPRKTNRTIGNRKRKERSRNDNGMYHRTLEDLLLGSLTDFAPTPLTTINDSTNATISQSPTLQPSVSLAPTMLKTVAPLNKDDASQAAQDASEAAQDAQSAAEDAQHSGNEQAAQAAAAAAEAAKKAANATHTQAAGMYQTALLNGDGSLMVQTIAQCFQNPRYGLAVTNTTARAYVFFDGSYYYRVNLTTPYLQIVSVNTAMPSATHPSLIADADYSDYILALMVLMFSMVGFLLLLQQVMGRNYQVIRPLYKFQRFLFDPMHHANATTRDGMLLVDNDDSIRGGQQSQAANLMKNVIPSSMGGIQSSLPRVSKRKKKNDDASDSANDEWGLGAGDDGLDMEMVECPVRLHAESLSETDLTVNALSRSSSTSNLANCDISRRLFRDPDLVDLPTLASSSKVAMPVGFGNGSQTLEED